MIQLDAIRLKKIFWTPRGARVATFEGGSGGQFGVIIDIAIFAHSLVSDPIRCNLVEKNILYHQRARGQLL